jgi:carbamoyl-phosphate synthase large subunit
MKKQYNILVTGVGAIIGYGIIESLKLSNLNCKIIGTDIYEENYGKYICDEFIQVPYTNNPDYQKIISNLVSKYKIDLIFPGIEQDLYYFINNQNLFNTKIVLNISNLVHLSKDKFIMYNYLENRLCPFIIPTYINFNYQMAVKTLGLPFVIKPKSSYASKGFYVINNEEKFNKISDEINENTLFQPCVGTIDEEYTISIFGDGNGGFIDFLILRRYLSIAGASEKTYVIKNHVELMNAVTFLVELFRPEGPTNFQFRKDKDKVYLLEINPRISSACSLRTKFGYNEPLLCIQHYLENKSYTIQNKKDGKAIRFIADKLIYE